MSYKLSVQIDESLQTQIDRAAQILGLTTSDIVRTALEEKIESYRQDEDFQQKRANWLEGNDGLGPVSPPESAVEPPASVEVHAPEGLL